MADIRHTPTDIDEAASGLNPRCLADELVAAGIIEPSRANAVELRVKQQNAIRRQRERMLDQIDVVAATLDALRTAVRFGYPCLENDEGVACLDAIYDLTEIDAVHDRAREIDHELAPADPEWGAEADYRYDLAREQGE